MTKQQIIFTGLAIILAAAFCFSVNLFAAELDPENPQWLFDENGNVEGWGSQNAITIVGVSKGVLKLETTGSDPFIFCGIGNTPLVWANQPAYLKVDAKKHPKLYAKMYLSPKNGKIEFYYVTEKDTQWSERQVKRWENIVPSGEMEEYEFDMGWQGTITGLRIDFSDIAGIEVEIDYLSFVGHVGEKPKAVQSAGKLIETWARIKS